MKTITNIIYSCWREKVEITYVLFYFYSHYEYTWQQLKYIHKQPLQ